jgi:hypothetical protein
LLDQIEDDQTNEPTRHPLLQYCTDDLVNEMISDMNQVQRLRCHAHELQLAIKDGLKLEEVDALINKVSKIVRNSRHSTSLMDQLRELGKNLRAKNATRWNSIYLMIKSFLKLTMEEIKALTGEAFDLILFSFIPI